MSAFTTITPELTAEILRYVHHEREGALSKGERLDILYLHSYFRSLGTPRASETFAQMVGRSDKLVKLIWSDYLKTKQVTVVAPPANRMARPTRIPDNGHVFVRNRRLDRTRTVARNVMDFLVENRFMYLDYNDSKAIASGERNVQRYLLRHGFKR
ncbi:unnamed protein product [Aphanomyces euteiches]